MPSVITVCAHRGASGTHPENTVSAMRHAAELGCEMVRARMPSSYFSTAALLAADPQKLPRVRYVLHKGRAARSQPAAKNNQKIQQVLESVLYGSDVVHQGARLYRDRHQA